MTDLKTGPPSKGDWKKKIPACTKRGNHIYQGKYYRDKDSEYVGHKLVCIEPGCGFVAPTVKMGPMPPKEVAKRRSK